MALVFSFDAETNGLWGQAFAIAAVLHDTETGETTDFIGRCPISEPVDQWVAENVLPQMESIEVTHGSYESMLKAFIDFYNAHKQGATILVHMGLPVEARLFLDAHAMGILGDWDAPYPLVDIAAIPEINTSVDSYNAEHGIERPAFDGGTHNPLYDSWSALKAYTHWLATH